MRVEAPLFKRCLCCLPLRYGLLSIGYLKIVIGILLIPPWIIEELSPDGQISPMFLVFKYFATLIFVGDTALAVVFVIGCHKKHVKLLKIYNNFSIGFCIASTLLWLAFFLYVLDLLVRSIGVRYATDTLIYIFILGFLNTCFDGYLIFLTRSEILKLENSTQFSFSNNANEAECAMVNETDNHVKNSENDDINLTKPILVNDNDGKEVIEILVDDDDEEKSQNKLYK